MNKKLSLILLSGLFAVGAAFADDGVGAPKGSEVTQQEKKVIKESTNSKHMNKKAKNGKKVKIEKSSEEKVESSSQTE